MRRFLTFILLFLFYNGLNAQQVVKLLMYENNIFPDKSISRNMIKQQDVWEYKLKSDGVLDSTLTELHDYFYNSDSLLVEEDVSAADNPLEGKRKLKRTDSKEKFLGRKVFYTYDIQGQVIKKGEEFYFSYASNFKSSGRSNHEFGYNSDGDMIFDITYRVKDSSFIESNEREYDNGRLVKVTRSTKDYSKYVSKLIEYDKDGNLLKFKSVGPKGYNYSPYAYSFTAETDTTTENWRTITTYNDKKKVNHRYKFFRDELCTEITTYSEASDENVINVTKEKFYYNADGTLNTMLRFYNDEPVRSYKYYYKR
jgi:ribosomal protein L35AE/L33A